MPSALCPPPGIRGVSAILKGWPGRAPWEGLQPRQLNSQAQKGSHRWRAWSQGCQVPSLPEPHSATITGGPRGPRTSRSPEPWSRGPGSQRGHSSGRGHCREGTPPTSQGRGGERGAGPSPPSDRRRQQQGQAGRAESVPGASIRPPFLTAALSTPGLPGSGWGTVTCSGPSCCGAEPWALGRLTLAFRGTDSGSREAPPREAGPPQSGLQQHPGPPEPQLPNFHPEAPRALGGIPPPSQALLQGPSYLSLPPSGLTPTLGTPTKAPQCLWGLTHTPVCAPTLSGNRQGWLCPNPWRG